MKTEELRKVAMIDVYNIKGEVVGKTALSREIFEGTVNEALLHPAVVSYLAGRRKGTAKTKTRSEVSGGGVKPWKQKGTGRARAGSNTSPLWRRGATVFGPRPRDYSYSLPQKVRRLALLSALSSKLNDDKIAVLDKLELERIKTKDMVAILQSLKAESKSLLILTNPDDEVKKSSRNIANFHLRAPFSLNTYDVLSHEKILITKEALSQLEERLLNKMIKNSPRRHEEKKEKMNKI